MSYLFLGVAPILGGVSLLRASAARRMRRIQSVRVGGASGTAASRPRRYSSSRCSSRRRWA